MNCLSGRGRTGTFSALIISELKHIKTNSELVDIIVQLREKRDGMVETPDQFHFISEMLSLPNTNLCNKFCQSQKHLNQLYQNPNYILSFFIGIISMIIIISLSFIIHYIINKCFRYNNNNKNNKSYEKLELLNKKDKNSYSYQYQIKSSPIDGFEELDKYQ